MNFPFLGLHDVVDEILVERCRGVRNIHSSPAYHTILYAWRLKLGDLRGAATALYERLLRLKSSSSSASLAVSSTATTFRADDDSAGAEPGISSLAIPQAYLTLINLLACLDDTDQAWILSSASSTASKSNHQDHHHPSNMTESPSRTFPSLSFLFFFFWLTWNLIISRFGALFFSINMEGEGENGD